MQKDMIDHVMIVGGGTAGWLVAARLARQLNCRAEGAVQVTLVESPDIPTIGVGEGTWPTMRKTLAQIGLDEAEFMRRCDASFKQGTQFVNWRNTPVNGQNNHYYHLFSTITDAGQFNLSPYWTLDGQPGCYADYVSAQAEVCRQQLAPKLITNRPYEGLLNYAYHLDAGKFADLLREHAVEKLGVRHVQANVGNIDCDQQGFIRSLETDVAGKLSADLFIDCSGFSGLLIDKLYKIKFHDVKDCLLTDHAIAIQVPYESEQQAIQSCTLSVAQTAGWIWDIGLGSRRGTGHVYCADFISHDQAEQQLRDYIGPDSQHLSARHIKMRCGMRDKFWYRNCVAVGLSAAFVEPLEASAIFLVEAAANMLCEQFPRHRDQLASLEEQFNASLRFRWHRTIDFIKLHYLLSQRQEAFWRHNREDSEVPQRLETLLEKWRNQSVSQYDFPSLYEPFVQDSYQFVLHGMGFTQSLAPYRVSFQQQQQVGRYQQQLQSQRTALLQQLTDNRTLLNKVRQFGFQPL